MFYGVRLTGRMSMTTYGIYLQTMRKEDEMKEKWMDENDVNFLQSFLTLDICENGY